jgi:hypothetical protein
MYRRPAAKIEIGYRHFDLKTATPTSGVFHSRSVSLVDRGFPIDLMLVGIGRGTSPAHINFQHNILNHY